MTSFDAYEILEIERDADSITIRRAYQRLARRYHPDIAPGDAAALRFQEVERAWRMLGDPRSQRPASRDDDPPTGASADRSAEVEIGFAEAVRGTILSLSVQRERVCDACDGGPPAVRRACGRCAGRGVLVDLDRVRVRLPAAIEDGARVRLRGRGDVVLSEDAAPGDLYLTVRVRPHEYFRREGLDVHAEVPVTYAEAALGAEIDVPTLDGPVRVKLPAGTQGGQRFRLRERGVRAPGGVTGDHRYRVRIAVPRRVGEGLRRFLEDELSCALQGEDRDPRAELPREPV